MKTKIVSNLEAWAKLHVGYDPTFDYTYAETGAEPDDYVSMHFRQAEFTCNHCGKLHPTNPTPPAEVLEWLEIIRTHFGNNAVSVNSGYRCPIHNKNVGGATSSLHLEGQAVDFSIVDVAPSLVYEYCDKLINGLGGVGKYNTFTHIDNRGYKARW